MEFSLQKIGKIGFGGRSRRDERQRESRRGSAVARATPQAIGGSTIIAGGPRNAPFRDGDSRSLEIKQSCVSIIVAESLATMTVTGHMMQIDGGSGGIRTTVVMRWRRRSGEFFTSFVSKP